MQYPHRLFCLKMEPMLRRQRRSPRRPDRPAAVQTADETCNETLAQAGQALVGLGFRPSEARQALRTIDAEGRARGSLNQVLRAALAALA